ncbi:magnesium transporter CorA family protein [Pseudofrankia inefficax]|uniref:Mg2 transporter protein CorA family protein n=1 Tax=Pseudofrankia inefficax (strain DSM 45817 / CECT 9037 / DDB 130130 / EuI1c) TaxID=298654 RepID=E3IZQ8_PSEI1|nr:magnesium transporter CorA family protein [Pseudofrankia inefficax]ADP83976.1 Mg2 transporter protein CorA family protein [Pseudofrankia inefficax]
MDVRLITHSGIRRHPVEALAGLLAGGEGLLWVDVPDCDPDAARVLADVFGFAPGSVHDCVERNRVPKVHADPDHLFVVLHAPERGAGGHVHYVELDQFVGTRYLVTVHGPVNPAVDGRVALRDTRAVLDRLESGKLRPSTPFELSHAIVSTLTHRLEDFVEMLTGDVWKLEQRVTGGNLDDPEQLLDELFRARHGLLAARTMAASSREIYHRISTLADTVPVTAGSLVTDLVDQFDRVRTLADNQREYLQGVIEFYRTRTETKMTIAAERFAVIAAVTLPITALSSVLGMNVIVNDHTQVWPLVATLAVMVAMSAALLRWARRRGWW